jgi:hypothetical protein
MSRFCIFCLLASFMSSVTQAGVSFTFGSNKQADRNTGITTNRPWGNIGTFKPGLQHQSPPALSNNPYTGAAPATGWYSTQYPVAGSTGGYIEPRVEVEPIDWGIYEQQNIIYTARVVSSSNLMTLNPLLPNIEGAALELVDGPIASARQTGRNREIINEYHFKLMPMRSGEITIPPIRFTGTHTTGGNSFTIAASEPMIVDAFPANPAVSPWLPLHDLKLRARLSQVGPVKAGTPVTLTLEQTARGILGNQLPSLQQQLQSDGFRAYRDSVTLSSGISRNGKQLVGSRKEIYTLIPLQDGPVYLPGMAIAWWDVDTDTSMLAELVGYAPENGAAGSFLSAASTTGNSFSTAWFWAPLLIAAALVAGFWLGAWARTQPLLRSANARLAAARQKLLQRVRTGSRKLSPLPYINRLRLGLAVVMPKTVKLWMCTRCIEQEDNPAEWCAQFRNRICGHLDIAVHTPLPVIAEKLIEAAPQAEAASVRELVHTLDGAIYGTRPLDFTLWKKELRNQLRPRLLRRQWSRRRHTKTLLPALNPHAA